jgi:hypothetical protein
LRSHDVVAIDITLDLGNRMPGGFRQDLIQNLARAQNVSRLDIDISGLSA